jgi:hypothetical protein
MEPDIHCVKSSFQPQLKDPPFTVSEPMQSAEHPMDKQGSSVGEIDGETEGESVGEENVGDKVGD